MSPILWLIPAALGLGLVALMAFLWALRSGQYEDLDGAAQRVLGDDDAAPPGARPGSIGGRPVD
jgi:cbb3-type cytochrome oxidase maturation protein